MQLRCTPQVVKNTYALNPIFETPKMISLSQAAKIIILSTNRITINIMTSNQELLIFWYF